MASGIIANLSNADYHASDGISKSGLWTIHKTSPAHYKYSVRDEKSHFDFGEAAHLAILEPDAFERIVHCGPDDRRGNKWKAAQEECAATMVEHRGAKTPKLLLTSSDYQDVLGIRDAVHADAWISGIITGGKSMVEASGYWIDPETGVNCRCRPDLWREDLGIMLDVKSTLSAAAADFSRSVVNYGYHSQEAFYSDGWRHLGKQVDGFVFLAWEKKKPYARSVFELPPSIVEEGRAIMRKSLSAYAACADSGDWPGYPTGVQELQFPKWAYSEIDAPETIDQ